MEHVFCDNEEIGGIANDWPPLREHKNYMKSDAVISCLCKPCNGSEQVEINVLK